VVLVVRGSLPLAQDGGWGVDEEVFDVGRVARWGFGGGDGCWQLSTRQGKREGTGVFGWVAGVSRGEVAADEEAGSVKGSFVHSTNARAILVLQVEAADDVGARWVDELRVVCDAQLVQGVEDGWGDLDTVSHIGEFGHERDKICGDISVTQVDADVGCVQDVQLPEGREVCGSFGGEVLYARVSQVPALGWEKHLGDLSQFALVVHGAREGGCCDLGVVGEEGGDAEARFLSWAVDGCIREAPGESAAAFGKAG
jgi:hypothetical protein